jgi:hypothetical protein
LSWIKSFGRSRRARQTGPGGAGKLLARNRNPQLQAVGDHLGLGAEQRSGLGWADLVVGYSALIWVKAIAGRGR